MRDVNQNERISRNYLDELSIVLRTTLGSALHAICLTGSAAVGAYREGSDLDVVVAVDTADRAALEDVVLMCAHESLPCPAEKLELVVYERRELAAPHIPPRWSLNFDTGRATHHVGWDWRAEPGHWFTIDLAFARENGVSLFGPPPGELIGRIPDEAIQQALSEMVAWYERNEPSGAAEARRRAEHWRQTRSFIAKLHSP